MLALQLKRRTNPVALMRGYGKGRVSPTTARFRRDLEKLEQADRGLWGEPALLRIEQGIERYVDTLFALQPPERPIIEINSDESPLNTKFSELFATARDMVMVQAVFLGADPKAYNGGGFAESAKQFKQTLDRIKANASSSTEATLALVELFNFLTANEKSNRTCGYRLSCSVVNALVSIPDVDLDVLDEVLLAYVPNEIASAWGPFEFIDCAEGNGLSRLIERYAEDARSGEPKRVEKARAWSYIMQLEEDIDLPDELLRYRRI